MPTIKASDLPKHIASRFGRRRNKYNVAPVDPRTTKPTDPGYGSRQKVYHSKAEKLYADMVWQGVGYGVMIIEQPTVRLGVPENVYRPDFFYYQQCDHRHYYVDVKGHETAAFRKVKKLWRQYGPCDLVILRMKRNGSFEVTETITPEARR